MKLDEVPVFSRLHSVKVGQTYVATGSGGFCWAGKVAALNYDPAPWVLILQPDGRDVRPAVVRSTDIQPGTAIVRFNATSEDNLPVITHSRSEYAETARIFMDQWAIRDDADSRLYRSCEVFYQFRRCGKDGHRWHMHTFGPRQVAVMMLESPESIYTTEEGRIIIALLKEADQTCFTAHP